MAPRDSQRSKVYDAENAATRSGIATLATRRVPTFEVGDTAAVRDYITRLLAKTTVVREFEARGLRRVTVPRVVAGPGQQQRGLYRASIATISLPPSQWGWSIMVVLHELAHHIVEVERRDCRWDSTSAHHAERDPARWCRTDGAHGRRFAQTMLLLVGAAMGARSRKRLAEEFKAHGVRHRPKRVMSPEQRARAAVILADARARKAALAGEPVRARVGAVTPVAVRPAHELARC